MGLRAEPGWTDDVQLMTWDEIPVGRDVCLIGEGQLEDLRREWARYIEEHHRPETVHPNDYLDVRWCAIESHRHDSSDVNIMITNTSRYHGVIEKLPRTKFVIGVHFWRYGKPVYVVVRQDWFEDVERRMFTLYALVDAIDMRALLEKQGCLEPNQVNAFGAGINNLARQNRDHVFLSFADSVIVKRRWSASDMGYEHTYCPERFLKLVEGVCRVFEDAFQLEAYAIVTQGSDLLDDDLVSATSKESNHVFFGSLGAPLANLFAIDKRVRSARGGDRQTEEDLYLEGSMFLTLKFRSDADRDRLQRRLVSFESDLVSPDRSTYLPVKRSELLELLRNDEGSKE